MKKPLVSVVIPAYNAEKYLHDAIYSGVTQKYQNLEIIVVDDGSQDKTGEIIHDWELSSNIVKGIYMDENKGAGNALRIGFEEAKGDYICWLSADDMFIDVYKTERQIKVMPQTNADWSYFQQYKMGVSEKVSKKVCTHYVPHCSFLDKHVEGDNGLLFLSLLYHNPINGSSIMFKRDTIEKFGNFDGMLKRADADGDLWLRYAILGAKVSRVEGCPILYRTHPAQLSLDAHMMQYGTEVTRCRALKAIEGTAWCNAMICNNKWFLYGIIMLQQYKKRPFTTWMLCVYVIGNSMLFSSHFVELCRKIFRKVDMYIETHLERAYFECELERVMKSEEYKRHLERVVYK